MTPASIRPAFGTWPHYNQRLRETVERMRPEQLAIKPSPDRWPAWATIGHTVCQRVFWLCDFAREPGADTTRFTNAAFDCPGDDDLEHVLSSGDLVEAIDDTFRIVDSCLDSWTVDMLDEAISHPEWGDDRTHTRGWVIQRVFSHDVYHCAELNETLSAAGLSQVDLWE
ncbi:MAG TPA: DinB family protein [Actinomycetota bacterium]|jgi:hypothetical protein|nr:DinB family protein [Actinomycetota bacterium]